MAEVRRVEEKRRNELTLLARLGRQDKANYRSPAPSGRKGLSAHWFLQVGAALFRHRTGCAGAAFRTFLIDFNRPSDAARNVRCRRFRRSFGETLHATI